MCYELPIIAKENNQNRKKSLRRECGADSTYVTADFLIHTGCLNEILKLSKESDACSEMKAPPLCLPANTYAWRQDSALTFLQVENSLKDIVSSLVAVKNILLACGWNTQGKCPSSLVVLQPSLTAAGPTFQAVNPPCSTTSSSIRDGDTEVLWSWTCILCKAALMVWHHLFYGSVLLCPQIKKREREICTVLRRGMRRSTWV